MQILVYTVYHTLTFSAREINKFVTFVEISILVTVFMRFILYFDIEKIFLKSP